MIVFLFAGSRRHTSLLSKCLRGVRAQEHTGGEWARCQDIAPSEGPHLGCRQSCSVSPKCCLRPRPRPCCLGKQGSIRWDRGHGSKNPGAGGRPSGSSKEDAALGLSLSLAGSWCTTPRMHTPQGALCPPFPPSVGLGREQPDFPDKIHQQSGDVAAGP